MTPPSKCAECGKDLLTKPQAIDRKNWMRRNGAARIDIYRCGGAWHVGHNNRKPKVRR